MTSPWKRWTFARQALLAALSEGKAFVDESGARTPVSEVTAQRPPTRHDPDHEVNALTLAPE
ncbi:hypothetical protein ACKI1I_44335 [Streptomyces turgidiscabies]|nr:MULTISPECIES: hypothetical protein [Streptomyces]MDX3498084.1 hypothetical protein [Streptomyces turgidiscabies]